MNSTAALRVRRGALRGLMSGWLALLLALPVLPAFAVANTVQQTPGLARDVHFVECVCNFCVRDYTEVNTNCGFLHDDRNLAVVYETIKFATNTGPRERQKIVEDARDKYIAALKRIASTSAGSLSADDQRIKDMWG